MLTWIKRFFAAPLFENDKDKTRFAALLNTMLLSVMAGAAIYIMALPLIAPQLLYRLIIFIPIFPLILGLRLLMKRGHLKETAFLLSALVWLTLTVAAMTSGGVRAPAFNGYIIAVLIAGLLLGGRFGLGFAGLSIVGGLGLLVADMNELLPPLSASHTQLWFWGSQTLYFLMAVVVLYLATHNFNEVLERLRCNEDNEEALTESNQKLQREITERKQIADAWRESEERLRSVVENVPDFIATVNRDGTLLYLNDGMSFFNDKEGVGTTVYNYLLPEYHSMVKKIFERVFETGEAESYETAALDADGAISWYTSRVSPIKRQGEVVAVTLISTDITNRKRAEETLKESESRYRSLFEDSPISLWEEDFSEVKKYLDGLRKRGISDFRAYFEEYPEAVAYCTKLIKILDCNQASLDLFEAENKERLCGTFDKIIRKDTLDIFREELIVLAEGKTKFEIETVQQTLTGNKLHVMMGCSVAPSYEDSWAKVFVSIMDITDRKMTEEALRNSEERYRSIYNKTPVMLHSINPEGQLIRVSDYWQETLGYTRDEVIGRRMTDFLTEASRDYAQSAGFPFQQGHVKNIEYEFVKKNGEVIHVLLSAIASRNEVGEIESSLAVLTDITERKRMEEALAAERSSLSKRVSERTAELSEANAELARAARLKDEFLANMSHELRTPLNAILGMSKVLNRQIYGTLNAEQVKALDHIEESGRHLLALINDILDLSKIEAGKAELIIWPVSARDLCQASLLFIKQMAHDKQLKVFSTFDNMVETIMVDQRRVKQILVNLLSNAVKFTPKGGRIGLELEGDQERGVVQFTVWDTGIGISEEDSKRLFKPFVQIDSSLSRQHEGTGLGLSLVYRLTEMHGGSVTLESEVGQGSRFTVSLPWQKTEIKDEHNGQIQANKKKALPRMTSQALILLAEDNETNIIMLQGLLKASNYRLIVARNGAEAIARAREERPDLILMDIQMPGMDGLEATRRLRADVDLATIPVVTLTALAMPGDRERCLQAGANEYLSKPVDLDRLIETIEVQLHKK